jgi:hypothetical protein
MTGSALDLLFGDDDKPELVQAQAGGYGVGASPGPRVQNIPRLPGEGGPRRTQPKPQAKPKSAVDTLFDADTPAPAQQAQPQPEQAPTSRLAGQRRGERNMLDRVRTYIGGNIDPKYQGVKGFSEEDLASADTGENGDLSAMTRAKTFAGNDEAYGNILKRQLGPSFQRFETDAHGAKVLVFKDRTGAEQKRYVNQPGLDWQDMDRALHGMVPYMAVGGVIQGLGLGIGANALAQGAGAAATRYLSDTGSNLFMGSNEPADWGAAGIMGVAGAGGALLSRPAGAMVRRSVVNDVVDAQGNLTARGQALAQKAGIDPSALTGDLAREFAETYAKSGSATEAATRAGTTEFGIPVSRGQLTKDPNQLLIEKNMRAGLYGPQAKEVMDSFDRDQIGTLHNAALGTLRQHGAQTKGPVSVAEMINPTRGVAEMAPENLGGAIREGVQTAREGAKAVENKAWREVGDAYASKTALADLPTAVQNRLSAANMVVDGDLMPASKRMGEILRDYIGGKKTAGAVPEVFGSKSDLSVDEMRRRLLAAYNSAAPKSADQKAAKSIYDAYDDWLLASADALVTTGKPDAIQFAAAQRAARDVTKDIRATFEPSYKGKPTPGSNIIEKVLADEKGASAEGVVQAIFGAFAKTGSPKDGVVQALGNLKKALNNKEWAGEGNTAWNDIRLAYWMRLVQDKQGNVYTPQVMLNNIQNALQHQGSVMRILFGPEEQSKMVRFASALRHVSWKDPNPSGTGTAVALQTREFITTMMKAIGWQTGGVPGLVAATAMTPIRNAAGAAGARASVSQTAPRVIDPALAPYGNALTQGALRTDFGGQPDAR